MSIESHSHQPEDGVVCPKCLLTNSPLAPFCEDCGAPIGMVATIDPIQQIHAEGFAYRSAVDGPPRFIIVVGMWILFAPMALTGPYILSTGFDLLPTLIYTLLSAAAVIVLFRTTKNYVVKSRLADSAIAATAMPASRRDESW